MVETIVITRIISSVAISEHIIVGNKNYRAVWRNFPYTYLNVCK